MENIQIVEYSNKAIAVVGNTKGMKEQLKKAGGRFNSRLSCGAGWIFPKSKKTAVLSIVGGSGVVAKEAITEQAADKYKVLKFIAEKSEQMQVLEPYYYGDVQESYLKNRVFFKMAEGERVAVSFDMPKPKSVIYYDDEQESPTITLQAFIDYNMIFANFINICSDMYLICEEGMYFFGNAGRAWKYGKYRRLTPEEVEDLTTLNDEKKEAYIKRLTQYFAKYGDKVYASGYYRNR